MNIKDLDAALRGEHAKECNCCVRNDFKPRRGSLPANGVELSGAGSDPRFALPAEFDQLTDLQGRFCGPETPELTRTKNIVPP